MTEILYVPTINDGPDDFIKLFDIWAEYRASKSIKLDFSDCNFIRQNGVAFLGGLIHHIRSGGGKVLIICSTLSSDIEANLAQNGFLRAMGENYELWNGNSIPYRHDLVQDSNSIRDYLEKKWIGKGWVHASDKLIALIIGNVWELYANAFEHSESDLGVFTCGQYYPYLNELELTVIDFGIGIPQSIDNFYKKNPELENINKSCLETAFQRGFSTKPKEARGLGLDLLNEFIQINNGQMDIYSNNEHAVINSESSRFNIKNFHFDGTAINIKLKCDERYYHIVGEDSGESFFRYCYEI